MLQNIHDKAKGWVAYLIVGFIAVPFALFGISSYLEGGGNGLNAATVNGEEIPAQQVQNMVLQQRQRLAQMFGGTIPPSMTEDVIKTQALNQAVNEALLKQVADKNGYRASNQEVYDRISEIPAFQKNGQFDPQAYEALLASQRRSKGEFENQVRDSISNQQLTQAVGSGAFLPKTLASQYQNLQNQKRDVETFVLEKSNYAPEVNVSADEIKKEYEANSKSFMTPERLKLQYVLVNQDDIAKNIDVNEDALKLFYDDNQSRYIEPEQRKLAHILVKFDDDSKKEEAKAKAEALYKQIQAGEKTFEELAQTNSDDAETAKNQGEIGLVTQGKMGVMFDTAAFAPSLLKGTISPVAETESGFEIIKVLDISPVKTKSFDQVKTEVEALYRAEEAEKQFLIDTDRLQTLAFENDTSLDEAADAVSQTVMTSDWIGRNDNPNSDDPLFNPAVIKAAFSDEVLGANKNSELIQIDPKRALVVRKQEHELPKQKALADVESEIKGFLTESKLNDLMINKSDEALKKLSESGAWTALESIGASGDKIQTQAGLGRYDVALAPNVMLRAFSMPKPEAGKKSYGKAILPNGDYVLIALSAVKDGEEKLDEALQQSYAQSLATREQAAVLQALRENAEIELFPENIQ